MPRNIHRLTFLVDINEEMKRSEKEIGVRDLTLEEIQAIFEKNAEVEALVRQHYPQYLTPASKRRS